MSADPGGGAAANHGLGVTESPQHSWTVALPHHARAATIARRSVSDVLHCWGLDHIGEIALLVVSELVTNAVLHTRESAPSPRLDLLAGSTWLRIEVHDADPSPPRTCTPGGLDEAGRGLLLIEAITDQWGAYSTATGKAVWAILPFHQVGD